MKISTVVCGLVCLLAACTSQGGGLQRSADGPKTGIFIVLPGKSFDAESMFIRFNLVRTMALFQECDFAVQAGTVKLATPAPGLDFSLYGSRGRIIGTAEGLRIMEFDLADMIPRPVPLDGGERRETVLNARDLLSSGGEPEQPALLALRKAALASGKSLGKIRLTELIHEGGGSFRAMVVLF